jgi:hypothetical protein
MVEQVQETEVQVDQVVAVVVEHHLLFQPVMVMCHQQVHHREILEAQVETQVLTFLQEVAVVLLLQVKMHLQEIMEMVEQEQLQVLLEVQWPEQEVVEPELVTQEQMQVEPVELAEVEMVQVDQVALKMELLEQQTQVVVAVELLQIQVQLLEVLEVQE